MVEPLEGLIEATKDLQHIDRNSIFYNLLSYCKNEEADEALGLWTKMQEELITPSASGKCEQFMNRLAKKIAYMQIRLQRLPWQQKNSNCRENNDEKLAQNLVNQLTNSKITIGAVGDACSCLLDIQCAKEEFDKALKTLNTAIKIGPIKNINGTALIRFKTGVEASGEKFPHT